MRQEVAEEHFSLRPFGMLKSVARNLHVPLKSDENADRDDTFIDRVGITLVADPANPGRNVFRTGFHATGGCERLSGR